MNTIFPICDVDQAGQKWASSQETLSSGFATR